MYLHIKGEKLHEKHEEKSNGYGIGCYDDG